MASRCTWSELVGGGAPVIAPSLLKCDFGNLQAEISRLEAAEARVLHWDVMDGHFVPNLSYGAMLIAAVRSRTDLFFDAHLMISDPQKYLPEYLNAGCDALTIHIEAVPQPADLLKQIQDAGRIAGLAINPRTSVDAIRPYLSLCQMVLVMSVEPGFGGQKFQPEVLTKVRQLRNELPPETVISIDGGIGQETISAAAASGVQLFVAGSSIFDHDDYRQAIAGLAQQATSR